ncbi:MAG: hypothetical protein ABI183_06175 [Polyangiaceae bacterium]
MRVTCHSFRAEPLGKAYIELIDACCRVAATFGLIVRESSLALPEGLSRQLERNRPYQSEVLSVQQWPGTVLLGSERALLYRYNVAPGSAAFLASAIDHLFGWVHPQLPEDLCFFRADGSVLLTTTSHERDGYLTLTHEERRIFVGYPTFTENTNQEEEFDSN